MESKITTDNTALREERKFQDVSLYDSEESDEDAFSEEEQTFESSFSASETVSSSEREHCQSL